MKARALRITLGSLACLALLAAFSTSGAQVPAPPERLQGDVLEPPPPPEPQMAPLRPGALEPPPPGTGFIPPPMDLSHLTGQRMPKGRAPQALQSILDWRNNGGNYVTSVKNQGNCGACYAFGAIGNFESKLLIDGAGTYDFSENNAKECNWYELTGTGGGTSCDGGNYFLLASMFSKKGTVLESCDPYQDSDVTCKSTCPYQKTLLDWRIISGDAVPSTAVLKQYIQTYGPVYTSLYAGHDDAWDTEFGNYDGSYTLYYPGTEDPNHAVLIVGWDDSLSHAGGTGGWIVKNSWGTGWGGTCGYGTEGGYFTIAYGSANIGMFSSFMYDWQDYDSDGDIMYYDEGGWSTNWGYGDTTGCGLVKFIPPSDTNVTRVEFWTADETTDVDVYIYDDFNGTTLSNLLASKENNSFGEAGYHSVELDSPLAVSSGNDVIVEVKFTNGSYTYPIPMDQYGPAETGRTYKSHYGTPGSWSESTYDVAIRLRTSTSVAPAPTVTSITPSSGFNTGIIHITNLAGSDFQSGATVKLTKSGQTDIDTTGGATVESASKITCYFDLTGAATGQWNVVVTNPDSQTDQLDNGFTVNAPPPAPDVSIIKRAIGRDFSPGDSITFTLTIANNGNKIAAHVVVTDILPIQVLAPTFDSTLTITPIGGPPPYKWSVEPLGIGESGVITIYGQINPGLPSDFVFVNRATISDPEDNTPGNNTSLVIVGGHKVYLPLVLRNHSPPSGWVTIFSDDFEGSFPGSWNVTGDGGYSWGKRDCRPYQGGYSGWAVGGGAYGAALGCSSNYPNNADSWMVYGPFSLADATAGDLSFKLWINSEQGCDSVCRLASTNGSNFFGTCTSGDSAGWIDAVLDLEDVYSLGNLMGQSQVWVALMFTSDYSINYAEGGHVDNIVLRKCTSSTCTGASSTEFDSGNAQTVDLPAVMTLKK